MSSLNPLSIARKWAQEVFFAVVLIGLFVLGWHIGVRWPGMTEDRAEVPPAYVGSHLQQPETGHLSGISGTGIIVKECAADEFLFFLQSTDSLEQMCGSWETDRTIRVHSPGKVDSGSMATVEHLPVCNDPRVECATTITGKPASLNLIDTPNPLQIALAEEISRLEGFGTPGTPLTRLHNPGSLVFAGQIEAQRDCGDPKIFPATQGCNPYAHFYSDEAGWAALHKDIAAKWKLNRGATCRITWSVLNKAGELGDINVDGSGDDCKVWFIAYNWPSPPQEKYAKEIVRRLKERGLLK